MMNTRAIFVLLLSLFTQPLLAVKCSELFHDVSDDGPTARFLRLLQHVSSEKGLLKPEDFVFLEDSKEPINPVEEQSINTFVYRNAFDDILKEKDRIDWSRVRQVATRLKHINETNGGRKARAEKGAESVVLPVVVNAEYAGSRELDRFLKMGGRPLRLSINQAWRSKRGELYIDLEISGQREILLPSKKLFGVPLGFGGEGLVFHDSPTGSVLVSLHPGKLFVVYDLTQGKQIFRGRFAADSKLNRLMVTKNGFGIFAESLETPKYLDLSSGLVSFYPQFPKLGLRTYVSSPEGEVLSVNCRDRELSVTNVFSEKVLFSAQTAPLTMTGGVLSFFDSVGNLYLVIRGDNEIRFVNVAKKVVSQLNVNSPWVSERGFTEESDGRVQFVFYDKDRIARAHDFATGADIRVPLPPLGNRFSTEHGAFSAVLLPDGRLMGILQSEGGIIAVDFTGQDAKKFDLPQLDKDYRDYTEVVVLPLFDGKLEVLTIARGEGDILSLFQLYGPPPPQ